MAYILARADEDEGLAERVAQRVEASDPTKELALRLGQIEKSVDERHFSLRNEELRQLPVMRVESLERHWDFDARRFQSWQAEMRRRLTPYSEHAAEITRRRIAWEATKSLTSPSDMPAALAGRIDTMIARLKQAEQGLSEILAHQVELVQRANSVNSRIQAGRAPVVAAIAEIDALLLRLDAPPLWNLRPPPQDGASELASLRQVMGIEARFAKEYAEAGGINHRGLGMFQALLLVLLVWLALRNRRTPTAGGVSEASARVLKRPLSSWLLLSMMAVLALEPDAPLIVHEIAMLVALVPVLRLLPARSLRLLDIWPYALTALYLMERLGVLFMASSYLNRLFHLGLTALALLLMLWLLWRTRSQHAVPRLVRLLRGAAWTGVALLTISMLSNVIGNVSLSETLTRGLIDSAYLGLMLYAGVTVSIALLQVLFDYPGLTRWRFVRQHGPALLGMLVRLLMLAAIMGWVVFSMDSFRILRPTYALLEQVLSHEFKLGAISITLGHLLVFAVSVLIAFWAARVVRVVLRDEIMAMPLPRGVGNSVASLSYYAVLLLGLLLALSVAGFEVSQLALVFGALGVGIGFGLQNVVNNFVSGLILMFERPIQPGDVIDIAGTTGRVRSIGMRATTIRTFDGADVVVPNGTMLSANLTNWTLMDRSRRFEVTLGVAYGSQPSRVLELLHATALETPGVATDPLPAAAFTGFGPSSLDFVVRAWTHDFDNWGSIRSGLLTRIHAALEQAGIDIPFPQQDLHLRSISDEAGARLGKPRSGPL